MRRGTGPRLLLTYALQPRCGARLRLPLKAVDQNELSLPREAHCSNRPSGESAWISQRSTPWRLSSRRIGGKESPLSPMRWCHSASCYGRRAARSRRTGPAPRRARRRARAEHDPRLGREERERAGRHASLRDQLSSASFCRRSEGFSRWGGWKERRVDATGFFRTHHDGTRWWLVDPDGHLFWSSG